MFTNLRHLVTPLSGASIFAPNVENLHGGEHTLKTDLVFWPIIGGAETMRAGSGYAAQAVSPDLRGQARAINGTVDGTVAVDSFFERVLKVFSIGTGYPITTAVHATISEAAAHLALQMQEYSDLDGRLSAEWSLDPAAATPIYEYALEALPFLREAYVQVGYDFNAAAATPAWEAADAAGVTNAVGFVIELGNPFDRPITFGDGTTAAAATASTDPIVRVVILQDDGTGTVPDHRQRDRHGCGRELAGRNEVERVDPRGYGAAPPHRGGRRRGAPDPRQRPGGRDPRIPTSTTRPARPYPRSTPSPTRRKTSTKRWMSRSPAGR